jgi:DNA mismatch repair protein MutS
VRRIVPGGADRSYGIHVAQLAGMPKSVTQRAGQLLRELENGGAVRGKPKPQSAPEPDMQLSFVPPPQETLRELAALDVLSISPMEALTTLFELQKKAQGELGRG